LQTRNFEDKTGVKKHIVEILIDNMLLLDGKRNKDNVDDKSLDIEENFTMSSFSDEDFLSMLPDTNLDSSINIDEEKSIF